MTEHKKRMIFFVGWDKKWGGNIGKKLWNQNGILLAFISVVGIITNHLYICIFIFVEKKNCYLIKWLNFRNGLPKYKKIIEL